MSYGVMIEARIQATNIDSLNLSAICETDVDGGGLVYLTEPDKQGNEVWKATTPSVGKLGKLFMAYCPSGKYTVDATGNIYARLSENPRAYTNIKNKTFDVFKVKEYDQVTLTEDCIDDKGVTAVRGDILESKVGQSKFTRIAAGTGATAGSTAFRIEWVGNLAFPPTKNKIGMEQVKCFKAVCIQE